MSLTALFQLLSLLTTTGILTSTAAAFIMVSFGKTPSEDVLSSLGRVTG